MENSFEKKYQEVEQNVSLRGGNLHTIEQIHTAALEGESFEDAAVALESIESLQDFRKKTSQLPFGSFCEIVEETTNLNRLVLSKTERKERIETLTEKLEQKAGQFSPRVADVYLTILAELKGEYYEPKFTASEENKFDTAKIISELKKPDNMGWSDWEVLFSKDTSWDLKINRIETCLIGNLYGARALDKREGKEMDDDLRKWRKREIEKIPITPPEDNDESEPGVDPMERKKEDEPSPAIWSIQSAHKNYCPYFREKAFIQWDNARNKWVGKYQYADTDQISLSGNLDKEKGVIDLKMTATVLAGGRRRLPIPYTHSFSKAEVGGHNFKVEQNQDGDVSIFVEGEGEAEVQIFLAPHLDKKFKSDPTQVQVPEMPAEFTEESEQKLEEIKNRKRGNIARAQAIASYVRRRIKYLAPKDRTESERYNVAYRTHPKGFAGAVDEIKEGDCDVVNTYFSALCAKLNIPTRHVVGHSVDQDSKGNLITHFGTGHAWSEAWDEIKKEWVMVDATPPGDPNLEQPEQDDRKEHRYTPGRFGEQEAVRPSDEQLEELRKKLAEQKEKLSYTKEEREIAEKTGVELKEARQIVKEINEAERTRLPNGELVVDVLAKIFNAIVESRKTVASAYEGPVRRREGGERIENIVRHKIGVMAGESDPLSRALPITEIKEEKNIGGLDLYMVGDKSGSMQSSTEEGERLWQMQRRAMYLIFSSLYHFERNLERAGLQKENMLSVRTQSVSFRGNSPDKIDTDKPLSPTFTAHDKVNLWHSLTEQGGGNGDVEALAVIYEQIKKEIKENEKHGAKDNRLRLVIACSDGGYVGAEGQMRVLAEELHKLNVVVVGMGLTETAVSVPIVMENPPVSRGDIAKDINDLPELVARHVVFEAIKLFPEKARQDAKQIIESTIAKFKKIK